MKLNIDFSYRHMNTLARTIYVCVCAKSQYPFATTIVLKVSRYIFSFDKNTRYSGSVKNFILTKSVLIENNNNFFPLIFHTVIEYKN